MAEAGGLQSYYAANKDRGFMMATTLNTSDVETLADWADSYGIEHPVLADAGDAFFWAFSKNSAWPMVVLLDHGGVIVSADEGASTADADELLSQYE
jgi:hypothetical protein